ncbi:MAG: alpha/beta hydrolase family protein [Candidatus Thorarchaeota archaeon]
MIKKDYNPSINDMLLLPRGLGTYTSPSGEKIAYVVFKTNLKQNNSEYEQFIYDSNTKKTHQLTVGGKALGVSWLNDDKIALRRLLPSSNNGFQIYLYETLIGEGIPVTDFPGGVQSFLPFCDGFVFQATNNEKLNQINNEKYGNYTHFEEEESITGIFYTHLEKALEQNKLINSEFVGNKSKFIDPVINLTPILEKSYSIKSFFVNQSTNRIFLHCTSKDDLYFEGDTFNFMIELETAKMIDDYYCKKISNFNVKNYAKVVLLNLPKTAEIKEISPDGNKLIIAYKEKLQKQFVQTDLWYLDLEENYLVLEKEPLNKKWICLTKNLDREPQQIASTKTGLFVGYINESIQEITKLSLNGELEPITFKDVFPSFFYSINDNGIISFVGESATTIREVYFGKIADKGKCTLNKITNYSKQVENWKLGTVESIRWKSKDGLEIQGIIRKPNNFDPKKKYPLLFFIHGGPTWYSQLVLLEFEECFTYPTIQLLNEDIVICKVNYRGSIGRGGKFMEISADNLGIGDMWDVESAIDYLSEQGFIDETKIGCMGWSQGGFISAFVGMHSSRFKAVSVGAGVSSWYTYFITSDYRQSLNISGHPFEPGMMEIYQKTAPISGINSAQTPMLLQHGANDERIGLASAMELYRALKEKKIHAELFIYNNTGHNVSNLIDNYAIMLQNYKWFMHHLKGEELDFKRNSNV